jgi:hypothetical protein
MFFRIWPNEVKIMSSSLITQFLLKPANLDDDFFEWKLVLLDLQWRSSQHFCDKRMQKNKNQS